MSTYIIILAIYLLTIFLVGLWAYRTTNTDADFMVGGHSLGILLTVGTFVATWVSAASMIGGPGWLFQYGYNYLLQGPFAWFIGAAIIIIPLAYKIRRVRLMTVPEFMVTRYGSRPLQIFMGVVMIWVFLLFVTIQTKGCALIMSTMLNIDYKWGILFIVLIILYTTAIGYKSVAATDTLNVLFIVFGVVVAAGIVLSLTGGFSAMNAQAALINTPPVEGHDATELGSLLHPLTMGKFSAMYFFGVFIAMGLGGGSNPQYIIRLISAKNVKVATTVAGLSVLVMLFVYFASGIVGVGARVLIPTLPAGTDQDWIYPILAVREFAPIVGGLIMASLIAAAVSSANSQLMLVGTATIYDVYKPAFKQELSGDKLVKFTKAAILIAGVVALVLTLNPPKIILKLLDYIYGAMGSVFFAPIWLGCFWKRANKEGAFAGAVVGLVVYLGWHIFIGPNPMHPVVFGIISSILVTVVVSLLTKPPAKELIEPYFPYLKEETK